MEDDKRKRLSEALLRFMQENNLSGRQLSRHLKLSPTSVLSYLDGTTYPGVESRVAIAVALGYTAAEFEAYLEGIPVQPQKLVEEVMQEIRAMDQADFLRVAQVVWDRLISCQSQKS